MREEKTGDPVHPHHFRSIAVLSYLSRTGFSPNLTDERYRKSDIRAVGESSHQCFQFPRRGEIGNPVVRRKKEGCLAFERQSPASSSSGITHTLSSHMNSFTSERSHTHISVQCEWSMCLLPLQGQINKNKRPVSHPDDIPMWCKIKLRVKLW